MPKCAVGGRVVVGRVCVCWDKCRHIKVRRGTFKVEVDFAGDFHCAIVFMRLPVAFDHICVRV